MCGEVANSGPDYDFLLITLLPPFKNEAQKFFWSVSAICLPYPRLKAQERDVLGDVPTNRAPTAAGPAPTVNWYGNRKCIYATFNILKVSKRFLKVLNFLFFSTTHQPTDLWRVVVIKCSTSYSEAFFNHQHWCLLITQNQEKMLVCRGRHRPGALTALSVHQAWMSLSACGKPDIIVWHPSSSAGAMWPDKEDSAFNKTYFGYRQCFSFPGENYQFHVKLLFACTEEKLQKCTHWELPVKWEKMYI